MNIKQQRINFEEWYGIKPKGWFEAVKYNIAWEAWLAAQQQEGYVMVPVEPTKTMIRVGEISHTGYDNIDAKEVYKTMIQVAQE